ncbi:MAG: hypothetical protein LC721_05030, partial [Actinobacteria bacterium]|nr:hypothetical protein [Actinomycetota bacterium]
KKASIHLDFFQHDSVTGSTFNFTPTALTALAQAAYDGWSGAPNLRGAFAPDLKLDHVEAFSYVAQAQALPLPPFGRAVQDGPFGSTGAAVAGNSGASASSASPQVAMVVSFKTALLSKRGRGRVYLPAPPLPLAQDDGFIESSYRAATETKFNDWVVGIENSADVGLDIRHTVFSGRTGNTNEVTNRHIRTRVDTQRRRLPRTDV